MDIGLARHICLNILRGMKSSNDARWTKQSNNRLCTNYWSVLKDLPDWFGEVIKSEALKRYEWRPEPANLQSWYNELSSDVEATATETYLYLCSQRDENGPMASPHPTIPHAFVSGPPPMTQLAEAVIRLMGGWSVFASMSEPAGVERKHFIDSYVSLSISLNKRSERNAIRHLLPHDNAPVLRIESPEVISDAG